MLREFGDGMWDELLPEPLQTKWNAWKSSLVTVEQFTIPGMFTATPLSQATQFKIHIFSDASEKAIAAVGFLQVFSAKSTKPAVGVLMGKSRLAPSSGTTIPRLELCAAVLATNMAETIMDQLYVSSEIFEFYTDSKVVLGYINNRTRHFYTYVSNRVQTILRLSHPSQWKYVSTKVNPADCGTRGDISVSSLKQSMWIQGPDFLKDGRVDPTSLEVSDLNSYECIDNDPEVRPEIKVAKTQSKPSITRNFINFSTWNSLVRAITFLRAVCKKVKNIKTSTTEDAVEEVKVSQQFIIQRTQDDHFAKEIRALQDGASVSPQSSINSLNPILDEKGIVRVGGRLCNSPIPFDQQHPILIPKGSHIAWLLASHFHNKVHHQGRLFTESAIRTNGYWLIGVERLVSSLIHKCVVCRKLRGHFQNLLMGNLPTDRVTPSPPFSTVGVDAFGPWSVVSRKTRGGLAENKRWAILFSCLSSRAVHIEVVDEMSTSSFINALRRFEAIRGPVREFRSDRGTNFVGALDLIGATGVFVEKGPVYNHLKEHGIVWTFNPPHAPHMGGVWERIVGLTKKILDGMFMKLTHDVLCTYMCEVCAIINSRPVTTLSYDPDNAEIITPHMLLTQKVGALPPLTTSTDVREMYRGQWKFVQVLSNIFWKRWRNSYLQSLQNRGKWSKEHPNLQVGDVILLRDVELHRNKWPMGRVVNAFPSDADGKVRSVEVKVAKGDKTSYYVRPVTDIVLLIDVM